MDQNSRARVEDVMSSPLETISETATVEDAARRMRELDINALVVSTHPPSIVTSTDVLDAVAVGEDPGTLQVSNVMTESVETVTPDLFLAEVAAMMTTFGIKHLPVKDDDLVGMVSSTDVAAQLA